MTELHFRKALSQDLPSIIALLADDKLGAAREDPSLPLNEVYLQAFAAMEKDENQYLLIATDRTNVLGCLQITFIPGLTRKGMLRGQIEGVRVAAQMREQGLGRQLVEHALDICRERQCKLVQLTTDKQRPEAHAFYERLGFTASHVGMKMEL